jgi:hypothetical protein
MAVKFNNRFNINNVVKRLVYTILALYVGGTILTTFAGVMTYTTSPFYSGLSLIGWTVGTYPACVDPYYNYSTTCAACTANTTQATATGANCLTATSGTGVLAVIGIIGIASIVTEFISW